MDHQQSRSRTSHPVRDIRQLAGLQCWRLVRIVHRNIPTIPLLKSARSSRDDLYVRQSADFELL